VPPVYFPGLAGPEVASFVVEVELLFEEPPAWEGLEVASFVVEAEGPIEEPLLLLS